MQLYFILGKLPRAETEAHGPSDIGSAVYGLAAPQTSKGNISYDSPAVNRGRLSLLSVRDMLRGTNEQRPVSVIRVERTGAYLDVFVVLAVLAGHQ